MSNYRVKTFNNISKKGLGLFPGEKYAISPEESKPEAIMLRSYKMHDEVLNDELLAVGRAGVGVNNVPIDKCTDSGVVVFNAPGANANAVHEVVIGGMFISARNMHDAIAFGKTIADKGADIPKVVEKEKKQFAGSEIAGKTLALLGLGAIGGKVANTAIALGMDVYGYDPYMSVDAAMTLDPKVKKSDNMNEIIAKADYISVHMPLIDSTRGIVNGDKFSLMKKGARVLNFSRAELVDDDALKAAIEEGVVASYVTDFPNEKVLSMKNTVCIPHIGASTAEAEENCATMVVNQLREYLENGNIINSVNFPALSMPRQSKFRLVVGGKNIHSDKILGLINDSGNNVIERAERSAKSLSYCIMDLGKDANSIIDKVKGLDGVLFARTL